MKVYKPPSNIRKVDLTNSVFLAGSIEMGAAEDWQKRVENYLGDTEGVILNPRRDDWDSSWTQSIHDKNFRQQVEWELYGLENAKLIAMYFAEDTISPITLLELGLHLRSSNIIVCSDKDYKRKGNVDITCNYYHIPVLDSFEMFLKLVKKRMLIKQ